MHSTWHNRLGNYLSDLPLVNTDSIIRTSNHGFLQTAVGKLNQLRPRIFASKDEEISICTTSVDRSVSPYTKPVGCAHTEHDCLATIVGRRQRPAPFHLLFGVCHTGKLEIAHPDKRSSPVRLTVNLSLSLFVNKIDLGREFNSSVKGPTAVDQNQLIF